MRRFSRKAECSHLDSDMNTEQPYEAPEVGRRLGRRCTQSLQTFCICLSCHNLEVFRWTSSCKSIGVRADLVRWSILSSAVPCLYFWVKNSRGEFQITLKCLFTFFGANLTHKAAYRRQTNNILWRHVWYIWISLPWCKHTIMQKFPN